MKSKHIYLNLFLIDFPITALMSIGHRITGVLLFLCLPFLLYFFYLTVESQSSFDVALSLFSLIYVKFFLKIFSISLIYHFFSGVKHIVLDLGYFDSKFSARRFSILTLIVILFFIFLSILL